MDQEAYEMCYNALGDNATLLSYTETKAVLEHFTQNFPIAEEGRINCTKMEHCIDIENIHDVPLELSRRLPQYPSSVYVLWYSGDLPIGQLPLNDAIAHFETIEQLCFDVWMFNLEAQYVVESHHSFGLKLGIHPIDNSNT